MRILKNSLATLLGAAALVAMVLVPASYAQVPAHVYGDFASIPASVTNSTTATVDAGVVTLRKDRGLAVLPSVRGTGATTNTVTVTFAVSADGTNYTTAGIEPLEVVVQMNGTNVATAYKNFSSATLNNVRYLRVARIINASASAGAVIDRIQYSYFNP